MLPEAAIKRLGQLEYVKLVAGDRIRMRLVKTGAVIDGMVEILSGLSAGESVCGSVASEEEARGEGVPS